MAAGGAIQRSGGTSQQVSTLPWIFLQKVSTSGAPGKTPAIATTAMGGLTVMGAASFLILFFGASDACGANDIPESTGVGKA